MTFLRAVLSRLIGRLPSDAAPHTKRMEAPKLNMRLLALHIEATTNYETFS
jgi:hypothetical protein